jgi:hypothetical protein
MTTTTRMAWPGLVAGLLLLAGAAAAPGQGQQPPKEKQLPLKELPWQRPMLLDKVDGGDTDPGKEAKAWVDKALGQRGPAAVIPGARPLAAGDLLLYRNFNGVNALALKDVPADQVKAGALYFKSTPIEGSLATLLADFGTRRFAERWLPAVAPNDVAQLLLENSLAYTLSRDDQRVYALDDLAVPPPPGFDDKKMPDGKEYVYRNRLWAFELDSGKIVWAIGGDRFGLNPDPFDKSHFLGAPLAHQKKLYVLNEANQGELRLVTLDPASGKSLGTLVLDTVPEPQRFLFNVRRRTSAAQIVEHNGLLLCLAHTGKVYAVELAKNAVAWTHPYVKDAGGKPDKGPPPLAGWRSPAAFVHDGKLIFAPADDDQVHCINAADGKPQWKTARGGDLFVAGAVGDRVLVIGGVGCRGLAMKDGKDQWKVEIGTPSGIGVFKEGVYLLPVKKAASTQEPGIAYLDVAQGKVIGLSPLANPPGNLLLHEGRILSQSSTTVTGYTPQKGKVP